MTATPHTPLMIPRTARRVAAPAALAAALAAPAAGAQSFDAPPDPAGGYVGPFGLAADGGTPRVVLSMPIRPQGPLERLQSFTFYLGDFAPDGSGAGLRFRAGVYEVTRGGTLGRALWSSDVRTGSGNYAGFDPFTFVTPGIELGPTQGTYDFLFEAVGATGGALNVFAATSAANGSTLFVVDDLGVLRSVGGPAMAVAATFGPSVVPEPATVLLVGGGVLALAAARRRRAHG